MSSFSYAIKSLLERTEMFRRMQAESDHPDYPIVTYECCECFTVFGIDSDGLGRYTHLLTKHPESFDRVLSSI